MMKRSNQRRLIVAVLMLLPLTMASAGCSVTDAVIDGFFGGISDTVAAVIADTASTFISGG